MTNTRYAALVAVLLALAGCSTEEHDRFLVPPADVGADITDIYTAGDPVIRNIIEATDDER